MTDRRVSLFGSKALAARIERAESEFMVSCSESIGRRHRGTSFAIAIAGGFATYAGPDSPFNKVSGLGFCVMPSESELEAVEQAFATREAPVQSRSRFWAIPSSALCSRIGAIGWCRSRMFWAARSTRNLPTLHCRPESRYVVVRIRHELG
jgi:hypothetical protein